MTLTQTEAAEALSTIEATAARTKQLSAYRRASPFLLLWGAIWIVGFSADDLVPTIAHRIWLGLNILGMAVTVWLVVTIRKGRATQGDSRKIWRTLGLIALGFLFGFATFTLLRPRDMNAAVAFAGLLSGTIYAAIGMFVGLRWLVTGLGLLALTFLGYFTLTVHYALWMGWVCGGGLILAGLWLRRV